jgi:chemotaxis protein methyltransferase CheR
MSDPLFLLRDLIGERAGLFFRDQFGLGILERGLRFRMEQIDCPSLADYHQLLTGGGESVDSELLYVITALSRPATSFFRHFLPTRVLVDTVLPHWAAGETKEELAIWSAGCSTGEEPVAIAMALAEAGWFERLGVMIEASDGNLDSIAKAKRGVFSAKRVAALAPAVRDKYFVRVEDGWQVIPELHQRIRWSVTNLANETEVARRAKADIVICKNVFIYFSDAKAVRVLQHFAERLAPGGYLFTDEGDHFNSLVARVGRFEQHVIDGLTVWKKPDAQGPSLRSS